MSLQRVYFSAHGCTGSARPGAKQLMAWFLGAYGSRGGKNLGIYNCRVIDGSDALSIHAEGRACDLGVPVGNSWSPVLADALVAFSAELGVQLVIHNRKVWSANKPDAGWRSYTGSNPHTDHLHVELTPDAASNLSVGRINDYLTEEPDPAPGENWTETIVNNLPAARLGHHSKRTVLRIQAILNTDLGEHTVVEDGVWGPKTDAAVRLWQVTNSVPNSVRSDGTGDGVFGRASWTFALNLD